MTWFKVDDSLYDHPKWGKLSLPAQAIWTNCGSYAGRHLTDGWVPAWFVKRCSPQASKLARELVAAGLWEVEELDGQAGWRFHDWLKYNPSAASVKARREAELNRQKVQRDRALREAVQARDDNLCRYCRTPVRWTDRKSDSGGTYDHVNPRGGTSLANVVVACRGCNRKKSNRTPAQASMILLPAPGTSSVLDADQDPAPGTPRVTCEPPMGRGGHGSGSGRAGLDDELESTSYDPADYELPDLSDET